MILAFVGMVMEVYDMKKNIDYNSKIFGLQWWKYLRITVKNCSYAVVFADGPDVFCVKEKDKIEDGKAPLYKIHNTLVDNSFMVERWTNGTATAWVEVE